MRTIGVLLSTLLWTMAACQPGTLGYFANWHLDDGALVHLQNGAPPLVSSWGTGVFGRHTASDPVDGTVLFTFEMGGSWTNVYDANGQPMPNGQGHGGWTWLPHPGNADVFYIFQLSNDSLMYSTVDMALNNGLGDVVGTTFLHYGPLTYLASAFSSNDGVRHNLLLHERGTNAFRTVTCSAGGSVSMGPPQAIGPVIDTEVWPYAIRVSPTNSRVAFIGGDWMSLWLLDLDADAGTLNQPVELTFADSLWSAEFSPNGELLYMSDLDSENGQLFQLEITSTNPGAILASIDTLDTWAFNNPPFGQLSLQLGNDGVLYMLAGYYVPIPVYYTHMQAIPQPDVEGPGCGLNLLHTDLLGAVPFMMGLGFPFQFWPRTTSTATSSVARLHPASVHPNPFSGQGWLRPSPGFQPAQLVWTDATGRAVHTASAQLTSQGVPLDDGPTDPGLYHLMAIDALGRRAVVPVMVE